MVPHVILTPEVRWRAGSPSTTSSWVRSGRAASATGSTPPTAARGRHLSGRLGQRDSRSTELGLHRVEAGTLLHNVASQQVLRHNGFLPFGVARDYLHIGGRWQDHVLFQLLATDPR